MSADYGRATGPAAAAGNTGSILNVRIPTWRWWALGSAFISTRLALWILDPWPLLYGDSGTYLQAALNPGPYVIHPKGVSLLWHAVGVSIPRIAAVHIILSLAIGWAAWSISKRFWVVVIVVLNPLTLIYERVLLSEHLFAALVAVGIALLMRRNPLAGLFIGAAAVTRTVGVFLVIPLIVVFLPSWRRALLGVAMFAGILVFYISRYVSPSTGAFTLSFLGPNAITVVAPIVDCPPAPKDICTWQFEHPNKIVFDANGPVQTRVRPKGWKAADDELRPIVLRAMRDHPLEYLRGYISRIPHLFNLEFHFDHAGSDTHFGHSKKMLDQIQGPSERPLRTAASTRAWHLATQLATIAAGILVVYVLALCAPPVAVWMTMLVILLGSILFNDATGRFLYPAVPLALAALKSPRVVAREWRNRFARVRPQYRAQSVTPSNVTSPSGASTIK